MARRHARIDPFRARGIVARMKISRPGKVFCAFAAAFLFAAPPRLAAQDVILTPVEWTDPRGAPDELPKFKSPPRVEFPEALRATPDIGYVVYDRMIDAKARNLMLNPHATQPALQAAATPRGNGAWAMSAGRRDGKTVNTAVTFAFIFNPATAAEKIPDATPRLLEVALVWVKAPKGAKPLEVFPDRVVFADVSVDKTGAVTAVKNMPDGLEEPCAIAAKNWRFAPARQGGAPVVAEVRVPFIIITESQNEAIGQVGVPPRVTFQARPVYPIAMRVSGLRGEVLVDFVVDIEGRVRNAFVVRSLNPAFDDPALEAVQRWRFEPGRVGDRLVNTHMMVPIVFELEGTFGGGGGPLETRGKADLSKLPEQFRYDTPPQPTGTARPVYPYALLRDKKTGRARVVFVVGPSGRVLEAETKDASAPEFGRALLAAIETFTYQPALKGGRPCPSVQVFEQEFTSSEDWQLVGDDDLALLRREQKKPESILTLRDLDHPLVARSRRPPIFPVALPAGVEKGEAVVEFLIDEDGRARLPRIVSATHEAFGYAAVQSIASWRFEPPTRGGRAVAVRALVPVEFTLKTAAAGKK